MIVQARTFFVAIPLAAALTATAAVTIFETPWNALPGVFGGMVTTGSGPLVALGRIGDGPEIAPVTVAAPPAVFDTAAVVELPQPAADARPEPEPNETIDYSRLNTDVRTVTDTLERFNQKLLTMIAQAKAAHAGRPVAAPDVAVEATVALDSPVAPADPEGELKQ